MTKNPLANHLKGKKVILASSSPRRKKFFEELGIEFEIRLKSVDETYPKNLKGAEISDYLAILKASAFDRAIASEEILITSDTVVWHNNESLAKAKDHQEAFEMLRKLSGDWHHVITSVCFTTTMVQKVVNSITEVKFKSLTDTEINYYIENHRPFDKAGAYGIQEWLGSVAIEEIKGSYNNVVGLPTHSVYNTLLEL
ncbi:Maf family nucleotide pyrophosphatase [Croceivirga thetidis]|uniref:dTTP/UTP pyrophosphatase n=1 Tax=Croceivirga thetidis TaxID=2721623 RepID=A0ABX1GSU5_9FLAO|nr:Maf family nucleotide pyrophosphatase [Croceivirga thetidis]NKI32080.1 septum formation protein Maf [Croceivirga thetidis]